MLKNQILPFIKVLDFPLQKQINVTSNPTVFQVSNCIKLSINAKSWGKK